MEDVNIEYQTETGNWIWVSSVLSNSVLIINGMKAVKNIYPNVRVRAVDKNGRIVDILP